MTEQKLFSSLMLFFITKFDYKIWTTYSPCEATICHRKMQYSYLYVRTQTTSSALTIAFPDH
ncbi:hypothetical protein Q649_00533 [Bartonella quintana JK 73]|uniref:Uncharacterized protein n=2 Tax=Bartonella quintana TaxID=803 RepID=W3TVY2_BARQI|nr:hypothetical protein Q651_00390 [Bartonella quintana BQ2-D70]ETS13908.1 hypothetical protein Q650_00524 [Bartonella quintana JK 73rel]ETS15595.1 hypothetical protein Q649_00533 [Bartonella quintana JK 73]KEC62504.1 hypothetical protein O7Y_00541 [Bartonella quintana JK 63]KEC63638.1 hypothetical protein O91_00373 [Bartonella quintana JK 31]KEC66191.1 hypothetical protein O7U_00722 [Bartonella quintana JK 68]KEC66385.1 hypothetical protein O7W_00084 [Bartonella quintana JK 56]KEC67212.1 hy